MQDSRMESISLSGEDRALLTRILESRQNALLVEIRHTSHRAFRDELREQFRHIQNLLDRITNPQEKETTWTNLSNHTSSEPGHRDVSK